MSTGMDAWASEEEVARYRAENTRLKAQIDDFALILRDAIEFLQRLKDAGTIQDRDAVEAEIYIRFGGELLSKHKES